MYNRIWSTAFRSSQVVTQLFLLTVHFQGYEFYLQIREWKSSGIDCSCAPGKHYRRFTISSGTVWVILQSSKFCVFAWLLGFGFFLQKLSCFGCLQMLQTVAGELYDRLVVTTLDVNQYPAWAGQFVPADYKKVLIAGTTVWFWNKCDTLAQVKLFQ